MLVIVPCKLGFGKIYGFLNGNINIQVFYIEREESVVGVMRSFTSSLARQLELVVL